MNSPNEFGDRPSAAMRPANLGRKASSAMITLPEWLPAMLNVLVVAVIMTNRSATPSMLAMGVCV